VFWVISVYFNIRNTLPKSGTFLLGNPVYIITLSVVQFYLYVYGFLICLCKIFYGKFYKKTSKCVTEGEHCEKAGRDNGDSADGRSKNVACTVTE